MTPEEMVNEIRLLKESLSLGQFRARAQASQIEDMETKFAALKSDFVTVVTAMKELNATILGAMKGSNPLDNIQGSSTPAGSAQIAAMRDRLKERERACR
jgi:hypothetical protein